jgi:hypothetical protein
MPGSGRRRWIAAALAAAAIPVAAYALAGPGDGAGMPAVPAERLLDSIGVQTHGDYVDTAYADAARVERAIRRLGIRHVRDGITGDPGNERHVRFLERLGRAGVRLDLTIDDLGRGASIDDRLAVVRDRLLPYTESLEGPNEGDAGRAPGWPERVRSFQRELHAKAKRDAALRRIPVLAPSLADNRNQAALGDLRGLADWANLHSYPGGQPPRRPQLPDELAAARGALGDAPLVISETGYHDALRQQGGQPPTSERAAAAYYPRLFLEDFLAGVRRTYAYELLDEKAEPARTDQEQHFGLLRTDFSPKPAAERLRRLIALARGPGGGDREGGSLDLAVAQPAERVRRLLLRRADGRYLLLLWQAAGVWDRHARRDLDPPSVRTRVELGATFGKVELHRVRGGPVRPRSLGAGREVTVAIAPDEVVGLLLGPAPGGLPLPPLLPPLRPPRPDVAGRREDRDQGRL